MEQSHIQSHFSSTNPHRALMVILALASLAIVGALVAGWSWHVSLIHSRERMQQLGEKYEKRVMPSAGSADLAARNLGLPSRDTPDDPQSSADSSTAAGTQIGASSSGENSIGMANAPSDAVSITDLVRTDSVPVTAAPITVIEAELSAERRSAVNDVMQTYWQATTWQEKLKLVREPESTAPLMQDFYEVQRQSDPVSGRLENSIQFRFNGVEVITLSYASTRVNGKVEVALLQDADGQWKIDWESYTGYSGMAWDQFKKVRPDKPVLFRTFAGPGEYWNFEFSDRDKFISLHLLSPDGLTSLHGFCERDSSLGREVASVLSRTPGKQPLVFRLAYPEKAESDHCVRILGLVAERWLMPP
jgi:hypothetical protein